jgi:hypothetical protein
MYAVDEKDHGMRDPSIGLDVDILAASSRTAIVRRFA